MASEFQYIVENVFRGGTQQIYCALKYIRVICHTNTDAGFYIT